MESDSELVPFPQLPTPIESSYRACTIPYRFPSDDPKKATPTELSWINVFANSIPSFKKRAESDTTVPDAPARAEKFAQRYGGILEDLKKDPESHGGPPDDILLCRLREQVLRELGFRDIFKKVKDEENAKAVLLFPEVVSLSDAIEDDGKRLENLVRGIFAGNIFDLGCAQLAEDFSRDGMPFLATCQNLVPRPWVIDDLENFQAKWIKKSWKKAVIFVDNSGADIILGILPFARELLRRGTRVVLAANELPSINDITYTELTEILSQLKDANGQLLGVDTSKLLIASSGNDLPIIDLSRVSQELAYLSSDADLVILEGMGRGIETNLYAQFKCDSLKIGMVKHVEVAEFLGGRLYDCVFNYNEVQRNKWKRAESDTTVPDASARAKIFAERYAGILEDWKIDPESNGGPPDGVILGQVREHLLRELGFRDIFKKVKEEENAKAISLFPEVVSMSDAIEDDGERLENLVRGIFAGNIFDLGSAQLAEVFSKDGISFLASCQNLVPRPWVIDDLDNFQAKWIKKPWKKAVIFVDNSGADIILGILPFAREMLRRGTQVVLAANELPAINDVTYTELTDIVSQLKDENGQLLGVDTSKLQIVNSGNDLAVIDLSRVSQELAYLSSDADLVILEGMGRGIETNLYAQFKCDSLNIGMVKHVEVAEFLGGRLYDCVFKYNEVES